MKYNAVNKHYKITSFNTLYIYYHNPNSKFTRRKQEMKMKLLKGGFLHFLSVLLVMTILSSLCLFSTVAFAEGTAYLDEDFSNFENGENVYEQPGVVAAVPPKAEIVQVGTNDKAIKAVGTDSYISAAYDEGIEAEEGKCAVFNYSVYHTSVADDKWYAGYAIAHPNVGRYFFWKMEGSEFKVANMENATQQYDTSGLTTVATLRANKWYQHSFVIDIANKKFYAYLDGQLLTPGGYSCYANTEQMVSSMNFENDGTVRYYDDIYIDSFTTLEAAEEAIRVKSILAGEKTDSYDAAVLAAYKTSANAQLAALRANGADREALDSLKRLSDNMIPTVKHVYYEENFETQTLNQKPVSPYSNIFYRDGELNGCQIDEENDGKVLDIVHDGYDSFVSRVEAWNYGGDRFKYSNWLTWEVCIRWNEAPTENRENFLRAADYAGTNIWTTQVRADGSFNLYNYNRKGDGTLDYITAIPIISEIKVGKWYDLRFEYDHSTELVKAYVDDVYAGAAYTNPGTYFKADNIDMIDRLFSFDVKGDISIDNLRFTTSRAVPQTAMIQNSTYVDGSGIAVNKLTAGGKVASTYVTKNLDEDYTLYTAAYKDGALAGPVKVSPLGDVPVGVPTAIDVNIDIPENGEIRQFLWRNDLRPVMESIKHYNAPKESAKLYLYGNMDWSNSISDMLSIDTVNFSETTDTLESVVGKTIYDRYKTWKFGQWNPEAKEKLDIINNGDYILMQFAAAEDESSDYYAAAYNNYRAYLNVLIQYAQAEGAIPVLVAPAGENNKGYAGAVKAIGRALNVTVLEPVADDAASVAASLKEAGIPLSTAVK